MPAPVRILVVDDHLAVRDAYRRFFGRRSDLDLVGEASDGERAVAMYRDLRPDVVLMDIQMPVMTGIEATAAITADDPAATIVALSTFSTRDKVVAMLRAGAAGYLMKDVGGPGLVAGIRQALAGEMPMSPRIRRELADVVLGERERAPAQSRGLDLDPAARVELSEREKDVLTGLARGLTNQQIGARMFLSEGAVKQTLLQIGTKFGIRSRTGILIRAIQVGAVDPYALEVGTQDDGAAES